MEARTVMIDSWPTAFPDMAALLAVPVSRGNHRLIITLTEPVKVPALPMA